MSMSAAVSFGENRISLSVERGDIELEILGYTVTLFWNAHWSDDGMFIHKNGTDFDRHWTWPEITHRLKFWRRDEFQWPAHN